MKTHIHNLVLVSFLLFVGLSFQRCQQQCEQRYACHGSPGQRWRPDIGYQQHQAVVGDLAAVLQATVHCIALSVQPVPPFQSQGVEVCNELYGAKLLTEAYDKDEILDTPSISDLTSIRKDNGPSARLKHDMEYSQLENR